MAEKKGFDLAEMLKSVSNLNTREQIEYLPFDLLDPDPDNFYSIDGLNELADSIATVGLVHPLRVRQNGERFTITSGHRRRAAIQLLIDSGEDWSAGAPCIVDRGESQPEFDELKLIFANQQRQKTSAELSREAQRVEELLCALKEKGFEFPGRMQDHVAQAMGVKASKLKRLHAIRGNLVPEMLALFDSGDLNEACAYEMQKLPEGVQRYLARQQNIGSLVNGFGIRRAAEELDALMHPACKCPDGESCTHTYPRVKRDAIASYGACGGGCCLKCHRGESECPLSCRCKRARVEIAARKAKEKADKASAAASEKQLLEENRAILTGKYAALDILARDLHLPDDEACSIPGCQKIGDLHDRAAGKNISDYKARESVIFDDYSYVKYAVAAADQLGVSVDFLLGRTAESAVNRGGAARTNEAGEIEPRWIPGAPEALGRYMCLMRGNADGPEEPDKEFRVDIREDGPYLFNRPMLRGFIITAHWPLPPLGDRAKEE